MNNSPFSANFTNLALKYNFYLIPFFSFLVILPMYWGGVYEGGDLLSHAQIMNTFQKSILSGDFYPSWAAYENMGYGSLSVRFYPPLTSFCFALFKIILGDWHLALCFSLFLFTIVGGIGIYLWAKELMSPIRASVAGAVFVLMPYHLMSIYNSSMYAEFAGSSIISFSFYFVTKVVNRGKFQDSLGLSVSYSILIFTHLPTTVIGSFCLLIYSLLILKKDTWISALMKLGLCVTVALVSTSVYWIKIVTERPWLRLTTFWHDQHFIYDQNFLLKNISLDDQQKFTGNLILLFLIFVITGILLFLKIEYKKIFGILFLFFFSILMTTELSKPVWIILSPLQEVQFPWRWLNISTITASLLLGFSTKYLINFHSTKQHQEFLSKAIFSIILISTLGLYLFMLITYRINTIPASSVESNITEKANRLGEEWFWTIKTDGKAFNIKEPISSTTRKVVIEKWEATDRVFSVEEGSQTESFRISTLYYPNWKASVNKVPTNVEISGDGTALIAVPSQKSQVRFWFEESYLVKRAYQISVAIWSIFICGILFIFTGYLKKLLNFRQTY